jgi:hypothetical protein
MPAQMVACIDVLEHVEPDLIDNVMDDIASLAEGVVFISFDTGPAMKTLSDGRNAHLIQQPLEWWFPKFASRWDIQTVQATYEGGYFIVGQAKVRIENVKGEGIV